MPRSLVRQVYAGRHARPKRLRPLILMPAGENPSWAVEPCDGEAVPNHP
jgi:hypothetical protein